MIDYERHKQAPDANMHPEKIRLSKSMAVLALIIGIVFFVLIDNVLFWVLGSHSAKISQEKLAVEKSQEQTKVEKAKEQEALTLKQKITDLEDTLAAFKQQQESMSKKQLEQIQGEKQQVERQNLQIRENIARLEREKRVVKDYLEMLAQAQTQEAKIEEAKAKEREQLSESKVSRPKKRELSKKEKERIVKEKAALIEKECLRQERLEEQKFKQDAVGRALHEAADLKIKLAKAKDENSRLQEKIGHFAAQKKDKERESERLLKEEKRFKRENIILKTENIRLKKLKKGAESALIKVKNFNEQLEAKAGDFYAQLQNAKQLKRDYDNLLNMVEPLNRERMALQKSNERLRQEIRDLEKNIERERGVVYGELGSAYMQAGFFDLAIDAYQKSLKFNSDNPEVHYKLGLLYKHSRDNSRKAIYHLRKYLELDREAKNKKEVEYLIDMLSQQDIQQ